ncbi:MAG: TetR/AcrR family transcriptional regulator [Ruminococcus flavefaciens]|nr:TetR/AcrR family transcriptional regulator [Ruminococcus flavefaciens]
MDLRVEKTKRSIINAFLNLRSRKPLEKITVKELAEMAQINKATFYLHYHDIYELSESLEKDVIKSALTNIEHPDAVFKDNKLFIRELTISLSANEQLIKILFEGNRCNRFIELFETGVTELIKQSYPEYNPSIERKMVMTYLIHGGYYTYFRYCDYGIEPVLKIIEKCSEAVIEPYK